MERSVRVLINLYACVCDSSVGDVWVTMLTSQYTAIRMYACV